MKNLPLRMQKGNSKPKIGRILYFIILVLVFFAIFGLSEYSAAATIKAASCEQNEIQTKIDSANEGDTVIEPSGTCTSPGNVNYSKAVILQGSGADHTIIQTGAIYIIGQNNKTYRITGFNFTRHDYGAITFAVGWGDEVTHFRIDHNTFSGPGEILIVGKAYGVIDNNTWIGTQADVRSISVLEAPWSWNYTHDSGAASWMADTNLGGPDAVYIENNRFLFDTPYLGGTSVVDGRSGARIVFRYNEVVNENFSIHDAELPQERGTRKWEAYNNT